MSTSVDASIHFYDSLWSRTKRTDQHHKCRIRAIARLLELLPKTTKESRAILELGCGSGIVSEFLAQYGNVTGVDQSSVGIETANARACGRFVVSVLPTIPLDETDFDVCVLSQVIEHFTNDDQVALLKNARAAVRPGGHLVLTTPNRPVASRIHLRPGEAEPIENWLDPTELHSLLRATGWEPLKTRFAFNFLPILSSRYQSVRAARFVTYDILRLRNAIEDLTSDWGAGDCTAVLAVRT